MRSCLIFFISLLPSLQAIADENWISVGGTDKVDYYIKTQSFEILKNKQNQDIALVMGRAIHIKSRQIDLEKWYVTFEDCDNKYGKLVSLSLRGEFLYEVDFVESAGTIASNTAEFICNVKGYIQAENEKKGI